MTYPLLAALFPKYGILNSRNWESRLSTISKHLISLTLGCNVQQLQAPAALDMSPGTGSWDKPFLQSCFQVLYSSNKNETDIYCQIIKFLSLFIPLVVCFWFFESEFHCNEGPSHPWILYVAQITRNPWSSCFYLPNARILGVPTFPGLFIHFYHYLWHLLSLLNLPYFLPLISSWQFSLQHTEKNTLCFSFQPITRNTKPWNW